MYVEQRTHSFEDARVPSASQRLIHSTAQVVHPILPRYVVHLDMPHLKNTRLDLRRRRRLPLHWSSTYFHPVHVA